MKYRYVGQSQKWIRGFILLIYSLSQLSGLNSQSHEFIDKDFTGSNVVGVYEVDDELIMAVGNGLNAPFHGNSEYGLTLYKLKFDETESKFEAVELHHMQLEEGYQVFAMDFIPATDEWICVITNNVGSIGLKNFRVSIFSDDFQDLSSQEMETAGNPSYFYIDTYEHKTCVLGYVFEPGNDKLVFAQYDHLQLDGLHPFVIGQSSPMNTFWLTSMSFDSLTGNMLAFYYLGIALLDSTLFQVENHDFLSLNTNDHGTALQAGNYYYSHSAKDSAWDDGRRRLVLHKYDSSFNTLRADTLGWPGQDNYPFIANSLDIRDGAVLVGGNLDGPINSPEFFSRRKKFYLAKYDLDLNQTWYREFGGDRAYILNGLKLLENGGAFAYGFITDSTTDFRYAYIMYVNQNGDLVSAKEIAVSSGPSLSVVNPGSDQFIVLNPENLDARVVLTTIDGRRILDSELSKEVFTYDLSNWPPGIYPFVFYLDSKPIKSGKWVKRE